MAGVAIQNIKILQKRYTFTEWSNGQTASGKTLTLDKGELGFDLTNLVLKIGTADGQAWSAAHEIGSPEIIHKYKVGEDYTESAPADTTGYFVSKAEEVTGAAGSKVTFYYDKVSDKKLTFVNGSTTATNGGVVVVSDVAQDSTDDHKLTETKVEVASTSQINALDARLDPLEDWKTAHGIQVTKDGTGSVITGIKSVATEGNTHKVVLTSGDIELPSASGSVTAAGTSGKTVTYVKSVALSETADGDHTLTGTTDTFTIPDSPVGSGEIGEDTAASTKVVTHAKLDDHILTGEAKSIVSGSTEVSVKGSADSISIGVDLSAYAKTASLPSAMVFQGVINGGTSASAPYDLGAVSTKTGYTFKVGKGGYFIDATHGIHPINDDHTTATAVKTAMEIGLGAVVIYHGTAASGHWDVIPEVDTDTDTWRPIKVNGTELLGNTLSSGALDIKQKTGVNVTANGTAIEIKHADTSSAATLTKTAHTYVDGLTFDEFGHVTGYTVSTEEAQTPGSGSVGPETLKVVASTALSADHKLTGTLKTLSADKAIKVSETSGVIKFEHDVILGKDGTSVATPDHGDSFTVVDTVTRDNFGHVTSINTKTVTLPDVPNYVDTNDDTDTKYDLSVAAGTTTAGKTTAKVNLAGTTNVIKGNGTAAAGTTDTIQLEALSDVATPANGFQVSVSGDKITLTGKATDSLLGLIKAFSSLTADQATAIGTAIKSFSGSNNDRLYGVNVLPNGKAFVEVPDTHANYGAKAVDLYAFGTDANGHVSSATSVAVIDGNLD